MRHSRSNLQGEPREEGKPLPLRRIMDRRTFLVAGAVAATGMVLPVHPMSGKETTVGIRIPRKVLLPTDLACREDLAG